MAFNIQAGGPQTILNSSSTGPGQWYRVHPAIRNITFQAIATASGATVGSTLVIEASNDGINPLATVMATISLNSSSTIASDGFTLDSHYEYVRAKTLSLTTGTLSVIAAAHMIK